MASRASMSWPFSTARGKNSLINSIAPIDNFFVTLYAPGVTKASTACVRASIPVAAVKAFGLEIINSGSFTDRSARLFLSTITIFTLRSSSVIT